MDILWARACLIRRRCRKRMDLPSNLPIELLRAIFSFTYTPTARGKVKKELAIVCQLDIYEKIMGGIQIRHRKLQIRWLAR